jgi:arylsulfatase B
MLTALASTAAPPNIVFVITDDQGYGDLSCHGNPILKTPHIDKLHGESTRLTDYHVSPTCAPTRGALMSAHYTNRCGPWHTIMGRSFLFEGEKTFGSVFKTGGYATGMFGKWHLGDNYPFRPEDRGFTEVVRHGGGGVGQAPDLWDNSYFDDLYFHNGQPKRYKGYCSDVYFDEAVRFIKESKAANKPFLAYISTNAPHSPFHCPEKYVAPYRKTGNKKVNDKVAIFYGMIANIDDNVGKIRAFLDEEGLTDDTIFIFTTDNGTASGRSVHNSGMRGGKNSEYDGGHRVPFFIHWPKGGYSKAVDVDRLTAHVDILPTLMELAGLPPLPASYKADGKSIVPLLKNPKADWADRTLMTDSQRVRDPIKWRKSATMSERWRLINGKELYDIDADPGQTKNVAKQFPEVVQKLTADYTAIWDSMVPIFKTDARIRVGGTENPSRLSSHDWLTDLKKVPWNQQHVRAGDMKTGKWALRVEEAGDYRITLMRWPPEAKHPIRAGLPPGAKVPGGGRGFRETPGKQMDITKASISINDFKASQPVKDGQTGIAFDVKLPAGDTYLTGLFDLANGKKVGPYYATVEKK